MAAMSAPIIGKPPEQKRGAVFGDLGLGCLFAWRGETYMKETASTARMVCPGGRDIILGPDRPVIPLTVTPAEPEPDPAVATYGELKRSECWEGTSRPGDIYIAGRGGHLSLSEGTWHSADGWPASWPVRVLSRAEAGAHVLGKDAGASVVVHEEPGTMLEYEGGPPIVREEVMHGQRRIFVGPEWYTPKQTDGLAGELAALLSTPEPTAVDPENDPLVRKLASDPEARARFNEHKPTDPEVQALLKKAVMAQESDTRTEEQKIADGAAFVMGECRGDLPGATEDCDGSGCPACDPSGEVEPTEDRTKPAPCGNGWLAWLASQGALDFTPRDAYEAGWHDAEQARKAGES